MKTITYFVLILSFFNDKAFGFFEIKYNIKLTSELEISNCLATLPDIITQASVITLSKGGTLKITEIVADVSKEVRKYKCNYQYTAKGTLSASAGTQESITFQGRTFGECIKKQ